jgi:hypothetical protein
MIGICSFAGAKESRKTSLVFPEPFPAQLRKGKGQIPTKKGYFSIDNWSKLKYNTQCVPKTAGEGRPW